MSERLRWDGDKLMCGGICIGYCSISFGNGYEFSTMLPDFPPVLGYETEAEAQAAAESAFKDWLRAAGLAVVGKVVAYMTDDGRTCNLTQRDTMPTATREAHCVPLYAIDTGEKG